VSRPSRLLGLHFNVRLKVLDKCLVWWLTLQFQTEPLTYVAISNQSGDLRCYSKPIWWHVVIPNNLVTYVAIPNQSGNLRCNSKSIWWLTLRFQTNLVTYVVIPNQWGDLRCNSKPILWLKLKFQTNLYYMNS
jgi:hypothetical protein